MPNQSWERLLEDAPILVCAYPVGELTKLNMPKGCEAVELRLDYLKENIIRLGEQAVANFIKVHVEERPTIVTLREPTEGGVWPIDPAFKLRILKVAKELGAMVDVEAELASRSTEYLKLAQGSILSRHIFDQKVSVNNFIDRDVEVAKTAGALVYKLFTVRDDEYFEMVRLLTSNTSIHIAIVPKKPDYRAASILMGTALMYCSVDEGTAPGQLDIDVCVRLKEIRRFLIKRL